MVATSKGALFRVYMDRQQLSFTVETDTVFHRSLNPIVRLSRVLNVARPAVTLVAMKPGKILDADNSRLGKSCWCGYIRVRYMLKLFYTAENSTF